ncbi:hypothetical protein Kfla_4375 [Kribbella flavida DSM 17836]|uniref:Uncharacterized protein n=1 Tax=Kribbella flavida (strain DSM 17836 / JCM 10339 / NBRC 14399) TaxID=479435 RepID=D2PVC8_KRIFD|nr:SitI3 family protein [Kribbella flavida]ADB33409.1 hypothetical protein Kfla_4375 [Kribbella flavida DSM 17836]
MAIEYSLFLASAGGAAGVRRVVAASAPEVDWDAERVTAYRSPTGLRVTVMDRTWSDRVVETPTVQVGFRLDKFADPDPQYDEVVRLTVAILAADPGDAVLQQDHEICWLLRRGDSWIAHSGGSLWSAHRLSLLPVVPQRRPMPYPD